MHVIKYNRDKKSVIFEILVILVPQFLIVKLSLSI